jgi:hypothetical protein
MNPPSSTAAAKLLCLCLFLLPPTGSSAAPPGFRIEQASTHLSEGVYRLDASFDLEFSGEVLQALFNGVPLTLELQMHVVEPRRYLWDATVATVEQRYRLRYHALSQLYQVENLNTGVIQNYPTRHTALRAIGNVKDFPLIDAGLLRPDGRHKVEIRMRLDVNSLPVPLRAMALVSGDWSLASEWKSVPLRK